MVSVSVVIVNFNTRSHLEKCLDALRSVHEIIVVDNGSTDGSVELLKALPHVRSILNADNLGFGAANNQGIEIATGDVILLLNSDAYPVGEAIARLSAVFDDPHVVAAGGKLLNPDGSLQESCSNELTLWVVFCEQFYLEKLFPQSPIFSPYWMSRRLISKNPAAVHDVHQVMGACFMMRPVERFDERIFLYAEDTELCQRLRKHGRILYVPPAEFVHELGSSGKGARWKSIALYNRGKELYFRIHHGAAASFLCLLLNRTGALLRLIAWGIPTLLTLGLLKRLRHQTASFFRVLFAPIGAERLFR